MVSFDSMIKSLTDIIEKSYTQGVTIEEAEKHAGMFLHGQLLVAAELKECDLDARMRKTGVKAIKAAAYLEAATKTDKKPTEAMITAIIDREETVQNEQKSFDQAEAHRDLLQNYYNVFKEGHIYMRGISKGRFE